MPENAISLHDQIKIHILDVCKSLGYNATAEYRGKDWRADVYVEVDDKKYVLEVQLSPQSLKKTFERQAKYIRDGIIGCWFFERENRNFGKEYENLPLFKVSQENGKFFVSLKGRKTLSLETFVTDYLTGKIKFCHTLKALPLIDIRFVENFCWKCGSLNYVYFIGPLHTSCNSSIGYGESMWTSDKFSMSPEIQNRVKKYVSLHPEKNIVLATIKERYSNTIGAKYLSFGCCECDAIFGDWYINDLELDSWYGDGVVDKMTIDFGRDIQIKEDIPHWCHPGDNDFCE